MEGMMSMMNLWSRAVLMAMGLLLSTNTLAEVPRTMTTNEIAASTPAFEIIPEDPLAAKVRFSDKTRHYKKTVYLSGYELAWGRSIGNQQRISSMLASQTVKYNPSNDTKVVLVDLQNGAVTETGYWGRILCYNENRLATSSQFFKRDHASDRAVLTEAHSFGKIGEPPQIIGDFPAGMELNEPSCQLVPKWTYPKPKSGEPQFVRRFPLKVEHGAIYLWKPKNFPELLLGRDDYNRVAFNRVGSAIVPPLQAYWELPSGKRVDIPLNPGEQIDSVWYVPYEAAYLVTVELNNSQPIKVWEPRFARLLYLDGTIKRFSVPSVIIDLIKQNKVVALTNYTRLGIIWSIYALSSRADADKLQGSYITVGNELIKINEAGGQSSLDGCKLFGSNRSFFTELPEYYYIDICKGE